jgi:5-methyltetrahydrofolate--homocysteine methyltransferase
MNSDSRAALERLLDDRILVLDGAMGTMIQRLHLSEAEFRGERFRHVSREVEGNNDLLAITAPGIIAGLHHDYLAAGSDIITTNTFNSTAVSQARYGLESIAYELNVAASRLAKDACADWSARTPDKPRFVAGSIGPTNPLTGVGRSAFHPARFEALKEAYKEQVRGLIDGGCDLLLVETIVDVRNARAAILAIEEVHDERQRDTGDDEQLPLMLSVTVSEASGRLPSGQTLEAFWLSVAHANPLSVGINCAFGARPMPPHAAALAQVADCFTSCHPSAGLPNVLGVYDEQPADVARVLGYLASSGLVNIVGGCCGTTPDHIRAIATTVEHVPPRIIHGRKRQPFVGPGAE